MSQIRSWNENYVSPEYVKDLRLLEFDRDKRRSHLYELFNQKEMAKRSASYLIIGLGLTSAMGLASFFSPEISEEISRSPITDPLTFGLLGSIPFVYSKIQGKILKKKTSKMYKTMEALRWKRRTGNIPQCLENYTLDNFNP
ncbi:hypothetical protein COU60_05310 [Candidatus Pacearchaeota archaeon CG10_big_fil_rev_8_21_14_0_10_34_76]|nr:MAG: hypothetical protein COU60_05310 [Candidatus Pacearchaeota archaeon CG10_big_fil_rev_8_21_14_0_10_34_76]